MARTKKHLGPTCLRKALSRWFSALTDHRQEAKKDHTIHDVAMSAFAMMFFQDPSLLQFQQRMEEEAQMNNLRTLFHITSIPKDTQMRQVLDAVDPEEIAPLFTDFFHSLQRGKYLNQYRICGKYIVSLDGSQYFSSPKRSCPACLVRKGTYSHQIVQAALMHPERRQVIPLMPEEVRNTDGTEKQDCEVNAAKRLLKKLRATHSRLPFIIVGDGLYSKQPFVECLIEKKMSYVLVAKEDDHTTLMEYVEGARSLGTLGHKELIDKKGRCHVYEWLTDVPLNGNEDTPVVNYVAYRLYDKGKQTYHNAWVSDLDITDIETLVAIGRCRWKIENEVFNTLKEPGLPYRA